MSRFTLVVVLMSCGAALSGKSFAACGGGGWKAPAPVGGTAATTTTVSATTTTTSSSTVAPVVREASEPNYDAYFDAPRSRPLDASKFDAIVAKLELSKDQIAKIEETRQAIVKQVRELNRAKFTSERAFDNCNGACDAERATMRKAIDAAQKYSANTEFETKLHTILEAKQLAIYDGKQQDVSTTK